MNAATASATHPQVLTIPLLDATQSHRLFGHSFGALVAVETARRAPSGLDRVVAYDPAFTFNKHELADFLPEFSEAVAGVAMAARSRHCRGV